MTERAWQPEDYVVSNIMQQYFANFILTGDPNAGDLPVWYSVQPDDQTPPVMIIDIESKSMDAKDDARYEFLDRSYGY
jgi:para-nitrobenzyl esterase